MRGSELNIVCEGLLSKIFQPIQGEERGLVVLVTSTHPRSGVSQITRVMAESLDQHGSQFAILLNGRGKDLKKSVSNAAQKHLEPRNAARSLSTDLSTESWQSLQ